MLKILIKFKPLVCVIMTAGLISCANYQSVNQSPENLVLILNQDVSVESGRARVFLQNGQVTKTKNLETYAPSCDFEVVDVSKQGAEQVIHSDEFRVLRVYYAAPDTTKLNFEPGEQYAQEGFEYLNTTYLTQFDLRSETQPDVLRLNCKIWSIDPYQRYLSPAQIDQTLGTIATFRSE